MLIVNDNVDVACRAIEKAASDRAISDVDDHFALAYSDRRLHREVGNIFLILKTSTLSIPVTFSNDLASHSGITLSARLSSLPTFPTDFASKPTASLTSSVSTVISVSTTYVEYRRPVSC